MTARKRNKPASRTGKAETEIPARSAGFDPAGAGWRCQPESEAHVKAHLQTCPECRTLWQADGGRALPQSLPAPDDARLLQRSATNTIPAC